MCSAGPEVAVLDWYGPEADPVYWQRGVVVAGLQVACEAHIQGGKVLGHPPPEKIRNLVHLIYTVYTSDFLCRLPLPGHSYILSPFHPYIAFMPVQLHMCISIITVYNVHYCINI